MAATTFESERKAISEYFYSEFRLCPIVWPNIKPNFTIDKDPWVRFSILNGDSLQKSLGTIKTFRYVGTIVIEVMVKPDHGTSQLNEIIDEIDRIFKLKRFTTEQIQCKVPNKIIVGEIDEWYKVNVNIPFYRDSVE